MLGVANAFNDYTTYNTCPLRKSASFTRKYLSAPLLRSSMSPLPYCSFTACNVSTKHPSCSSIAINRPLYSLSLRAPVAKCKVIARSAVPDTSEGATITMHQEPNRQQRNSAGSTPAHAEPQPEAQPFKQHKQQFDWYKAWYPLAVLEDLDPMLPSHAKLLGMDLAVWYDRNTAKWRVFQDRCPHRLAPLSEGRIDAAGHLYCNYHGWQFDGSGSCKGIPQLPQDQPVNANKSCAVSYPTCEREGLLWVWPDGSPSAAAESSAPEAWPGLAPEIDAVGAKAFSSRHNWYFRDLPASYLAVKENAYNDCSHDTVLHHGASSVISRERAAPMAMRVVNMTPVGYVTRETATGRVTDTIRFPCGARRDYALAVAAGVRSAGVAYVVPTAVGSCRQFHAFVSTDKSFADRQQQQEKLAGIAGSSSKGSAGSSAGSETLAHAPTGSDGIASNGTTTNGKDSDSTSSGAKADTGKASTGPVLSAASLAMQLQRLKYALLPVWAWHMMSHYLVDADVAMQSRIDMNRAASDHVYMPAASDAGPAAFMRWLREYGSGGPPVAKLDAPFMGQPHTPPSTRQQLLDRFHSHTSQCKACRTAYQQATVARQVAAVVALLCGGAALAAAALLAAAGLPGIAVAAGRCVGTVVGLGVVAGLAGGLWGLLGRMLQHFVFVDYGHQHPGKL